MKQLTLLQSFLSNFLESKQILQPNQAEFQKLSIEKRGNFTSTPHLIVLPKSTFEVAKIITFCANHNISIIPQSGNTGLVGGAVALNSQIIINTKYLNQMLALDSINHSISLQSGVTLAQAQQYAKDKNLLFPLSLPSEDTCTIGGNLATNAGGINVLKYGSTRDLCLGLEVVLPNGTIISDLHTLRKRNIGSDFKHLFIGSEGTLGFITAATFKLFNQPAYSIYSLVGLNNMLEVTKLFHTLQKELYPFIVSFELFNQSALDITLAYKSNLFFPLPTNYPWYCLISFDLPNKNLLFRKYIYETLTTLLKNTIFHLSEGMHIWDLRFNIPDAQTYYGASLKHDVSIPLSCIDVFIETTIKKLTAIYAEQLKLIIFGHLGDGNLHFNISKAKNSTLNLKEDKANIKQIIVDTVMSYNGSFSAEHGVGLAHRAEFKHFYKNNQVILMQLLKNCLDTKNIFNPDKIL